MTAAKETSVNVSTVAVLSISPASFGKSLVKHSSSPQGGDVQLMSPLAPIGNLGLAKLSVTNLIGLLECDKQSVFPIMIPILQTLWAQIGA